MGFTGDIMLGCYSGSLDKDALCGKSLANDWDSLLLFVYNIFNNDLMDCFAICEIKLLSVLASSGEY
jgi:hypothetical protein